jgi:hypothetical protein
VVDLQPPLPPAVLNVPLSSFTGIISLNWTMGTGALWYEVQEDEDAGFATPQTVYVGASQSCLLYGRTAGTYHYRIRSINTVGISNFTTGSNA